MHNKISREARAEVLGALRERYQQALKQEKTKVLDEFVAVAGCHRKHAIRLLTGSDSAVPGVTAGRRTYGDAVREAEEPGAQRTAGIVVGEARLDF